MPSPLVSVCMPVFNGQRFLAQAIESLLAQDYRNLELIVLDNQSSDATAEICRAFEAADPRMRFIVDSERVDVMEGHKRAARYATGEYFLVACDDDIYEPNYISTLMARMQADPRVGLVYSGFDRVDETGVCGQAELPSRYLLRPSDSPVRNFRFYALHRSPVPMAFGLLRREVHLDALTWYYRVDQRGWNHDNLYMLRLLSRVRVDSTPEVLFHYRKRDRSNTHPPDEPNTPVAAFFYHAGHQVRVTRAIDRIIRASGFPLTSRLMLRAHNVAVLAYYLALRRVYSRARGLWLHTRSAVSA